MMVEHDVMEITNALPSLKQKFLVDLVNGIDVNTDQIRVQGNNDGFFSRLWNSYTGDAHRRQHQINENLNKGLDSCLTWLNSLTKEITLTNNALVKVNSGLIKVRNDLSRVAHFAADTRDQLEHLQMVVNSRFTDLELQIRDVDLRQRAHQQMDSLFTSWRAGNYQALSIAERGFLVISELAWGIFGDYCRKATEADRQQLLMDLRNRLIIEITKDAGVTREQRIDSDKWLQSTVVTNELGQQYRQAVAYLGNQITPQQSFTWYVLNNQQERPLTIPFLMDAPRLIKGMSNDLLKEGFLYVG
jgi:hypothetical protein